MRATGCGPPAGTGRDIWRGPGPGAVDGGHRYGLRMKERPSICQEAFMSYPIIVCDQQSSSDCFLSMLLHTAARIVSLLNYTRPVVRTSLRRISTNDPNQFYEPGRERPRCVVWWG